MPSNHLVLCCTLLLLPSIFPSIRVFSNESALCIRWPKYWSFSFNISSSNEHPGLISFRMDWLDLLAVQGTLRSLLQHHSSKASILLHSAFFIVQLSHPYMTTGKNRGEKDYRDGSTPGMTQQKRPASMSARRSSEGIPHRTPIPHDSSGHLPAVNSRSCPGIALQSPNPSSQPPLRSPEDVRPC